MRALLRLLEGLGIAVTDPAAGRQGEELAYWHLRRKGFTMVARNYRRAGVAGEVDMIGWEGDTLVFVEVKARRSEDVRRAEDAVGPGKRRHLVAAATDYRRRARLAAPYRFDVVSVHCPAGQEPVIEHFRNAFQEADVACD
jgi:putative endonuclease